MKVTIGFDKMIQFSVRYGDRTVGFSLPEQYDPQVIAPRQAEPAADPQALIYQTIDHPLGRVSLDDFRSARSIAIAINDKTRPVPHADLLPPLLNRLEALGIPPARTTLLVATGTHQPMPPVEFTKILPQAIIDSCHVISHNCDAADLINLGKTSRGTPVLMNRFYMEADIRMVVGNIEPHHFMGYSGGVKTAAIGLAGRETINRNHALLSHPLARAGHYEDNPMRQEVEEIGRLIEVHFTLNAILNTEKKIVEALAGDPAAVMQAGIPLARNLCQVRVAEPFDLVIASAGGYPKDINFYQSQKALTHSSILTRDGGTVILLAACQEGVGSDSYEHFMEGLTSFRQVLDKFNHQGFVVGPHKAFQVARDASRVNILLVSELDPDRVRRLLLTPFASINEGLAYAAHNLPELPRVAIMPIAVITIPVLDTKIKP